MPSKLPLDIISRLAFFHSIAFTLATITALSVKTSTFLTALFLFSSVFGSPSGCPQEAEELFVATERNAKLRYEGYKKLSEM